MAYTFNPFTGTFDNAPSTLNGDSAYSTLCAISGDLVTYNYLHNGFLPLSGGTITGNLSVEGSFGVGTNAVATIYAEGTLVGINTETPNEELTVVGDISSSSVIYASGGNSNVWNESYSLIQSNSATTWNYQGTDLKNLSSDWVGGKDAYTNLVANSAAYLSAVDLSFLSVSANWDSVYNTVQSNSATNWNYQGTDIKALTGNWESTYTTFRDASSTFLTSETDSQTLSFDEGAKDLTISNGNTVSLSAFGTRAEQSLYLPLSGGTLTGPLSSTDSMYINGSLEVGSGLDTSLFVDDNLVGINTETPNEALTIVGNVSATGTVYSAEGTSVNWQDAYTNLVSNSAAYLSSVDLSFLSVSANWDSVYSNVNSNSANWESTYNTVSALSASWSAADEVLLAEVTNADSVTLNRGDVVYSFGATGSVMSVKLASNSTESTSSKTLGIINETIIPNGIGYATVAGRKDKMSFPHPFVDGDALWLGSTPGTFTRVKPTAPNHLVYLGVVERANNGNGLAYIKVQNGYELDEIHDVYISSVSAGDVLQRNNTNTLWINAPLSADKWNSTYTTVQSNSATTWNYLGTDLKDLSGNWQNTYTSFSSNSAVYVKTVTTTTPGISAVSTIVAVSALPSTQVPGTLYILI